LQQSTFMIKRRVHVAIAGFISRHMSRHRNLDTLRMQPPAKDISLDYRVCLRCQGIGQVRQKHQHTPQPRGDLRSRVDPQLIEQRSQCPLCIGSGLCIGDNAFGGQSLDSQSNELIAIVGGGIGGLALALALQQRSMNCVVIERDEHMNSRSQVRVDVFSNDGPNEQITATLCRNDRATV
jgi:hypothetical protein